MFPFIKTFWGSFKAVGSELATVHDQNELRLITDHIRDVSEDEGHFLKK